MNMRGLKTVSILLGLLVPLLASSSAQAQEWLKDRRYAEGAGYQSGDFILHPGIGISAGYDSNYLLRTNTSGAANGCPNLCPEASAGMNITPSLSISTVTPGQRTEGQPGGAPRDFNFTGGLAASYHEDFGTLTPEQRNVALNADARLDVLPGRAVGGAFYATYARTIQPSVLGNPDLAFNRDDVGVGADLALVPGMGTLDWHLGYQFHDTIFEETAGSAFDNITNEINTRGRWKFRPRTALVYDATFRFGTYVNGGTGTITQLHDSTPIRTRIGLTGLITDRLSLLAMVGWGASFFTPGTDPHVQQYDSVIGTVQLSYALGHSASSLDQPLSLMQRAVSSVAIGYNRDFQSSLFSDYYGSDRGYVNFSFFFAGRALLSVQGGVGAIEYPTLYINGTTTAGTPTPTVSPFTDIRLDGTIYGEYRFVDWLGLNATVRYTSNLSNEVLNLGSGGLYAMQWQRLEAYLGVRWVM